MMNILVTSVSAKVQLVQAFKGAVRPYGGLIVGTDLDPKCCAAHFVDVFEPMPKDATPQITHHGGVTGVTGSCTNTKPHAPTP